MNSYKPLEASGILKAYEYCQTNKDVPFIKSVNSKKYESVTYTKLKVLVYDNGKYEHKDICMRAKFPLGSPIYKSDEKFKSARLTVKLGDLDEDLKNAITLIHDSTYNDMEKLYLNGTKVKISNSSKHSFIQKETKDETPLDNPIMRIKIPFVKPQGGGEITDESLPKIKIRDLSKVQVKKGVRVGDYTYFPDEDVKFKNIKDTIPARSVVIVHFLFNTITGSNFGLSFNAEAIDLGVNAKIDTSTFELTKEDLEEMGINENEEAYDEMMKTFNDIDV